MDVKEKEMVKTVLLFSGGLDSTLVAKIFKPDVLLYCTFGHYYQENELNAIQKLMDRDEGMRNRFVIDGSLSLSTWQRKDEVIPLRNLLAICVASRYGDLIWMGMLANEASTDKTPHFCHLAKDVLNECYQESGWCEGRHILIGSPVSTLTKTQLVALALTKGLKYEDWKDSISCFGDSGRCGKCKACFKRWMAHILNGIPDKYDNHPMDGEYIKELIQLMRDGKYTGLRAIENAVILKWIMPTEDCSFKLSKEEMVEADRRLEQMYKGNFGVNA